MVRKLTNWVDGFEDFTEPSSSPSRLRKWAGIACIAGALERKVWVHTSGANFYPNLYVFLVSPPGVGKSRVLNATYNLWSKLKDHKLSAPNVSKASLIDELEDARRAVIRPNSVPSTIEFNSLKVLVSELGVFLPEFANDFMNTLTDIYDGYPYAERKRTRNLQLKIDRPQINLLTGTTPNYLNALLPEGAWDQGFLSRTMLIYGAERKLKSLFEVDSYNNGLEKELEIDLQRIGNLYGEMKFTKDAASMVDHWHLNGQEPQPSHPKLQNYLTRRTGHLLKLCQVASANVSDDLIITVDHVNMAMDWMVDAESAIPEIFKAMANGGDGKIVEECWHFLFQYKSRFKHGAPSELLVRFLTERTPSHNVERLISLMEKGGLIRQIAIKGKGFVYEAKNKDDFQ